MSLFHRVAIGVLLCSAQTLVFASTARSDPSGSETWFLYEVNRARSNPPAWATELGLDDVIGGDGELVTLVGVAPAPPLAVSSVLTDSAAFKAEEMAANDYFAHESEVGPGFVWPNDLVRNQFDYPLPLASGDHLFLDDASDVELITGGYGAPFSSTDLAIAQNAVIALVVDLGVPSLAHREQLLAMTELAEIYTEAGAGQGFNFDATLRNYWAFHMGFTDPAGLFVTGVVYDDLDEDGLYDPGEGLAGVAVHNSTASVLTNASGGYALAVAAGTYQMHCEGGAFVGESHVQVTVATDNRALDCISGDPGGVLDFVPVPEPALVIAQLSALMALSALVARRRRRIRFSTLAVRRQA